MIIVRGEGRFDPGEVERLREPLRAWVEEVRQREGCLSYHCGIDLTEPDKVILMAAWRDEEALDAHMADLGSLTHMLAGAQLHATRVDAYQATFLKTTLGD